MAEATFTEITYDANTGQTIYSDVDLSFKPHPVTGDIVKTKNATVIKQSMRNILQTRQNERLGHPEIGAGVQELLFEPMNSITESRIVRKIADIITKAIVILLTINGFLVLITSFAITVPAPLSELSMTEEHLNKIISMNDNNPIGPITCSITCI